MPTLLLRLVGPMQAWGTQSRFSIRDTGLEPSKSGVVGLLCAALGKPRDENHPDNLGKPRLAQLTGLMMGVRVDREGVMKMDYQTAGGTHRRGDDYGIVRASGTLGKNAVISQRYYLSDADFLVGLECDDLDLLRRLEEALTHPCWQIYLGRKSFIPGLPVVLADGRQPTGLRESLECYPRFERRRNDSLERIRLVLDATPETATEVRHDVPLSFAERRFTIRYVLTDYILIPKGGQ